MTGRRVLPFAVAVALLLLGGAGAWLLLDTPGTLVNEPPPRLGATPATSDDAVTVTVAEGESAEEVGEKLEQAGVIQSARLFRVLAALRGVEESLVAGEYEFHVGETAQTAVRRISEGVTASLLVTVREGLRQEEIGELLELRGVIAAAEFDRALGDVYQAPFLEELPDGAGLEGFLFPATYGFSRQTSGHEAVQQMLDAFGDRYVEEIQPRLQASGRTLLEVITLASIIEREAQVPEERPLIAGVFVNRLEQGIPLQADPTVQYALGNDPASVAEFGYWKQELSAADLVAASPYNTYERVGLPPGPIANPGLDSILAALEPADTNNLFFVARPDGSHVFAETLEEHRQNVCAIDPGRPEC